MVFVSFSVLETTFARSREGNPKLKPKNKEKEFQGLDIYSFGMGNISPLIFASFVFQI